MGCGFRSYRVIGLRVSGLGWFAGLGFRGYGFGISRVPPQHLQTDILKDGGRPPVVA